MTYGQFKENLKNLLSGDTDLRSDDDAILSAYKGAMDSVISDTEPLVLVTCDIERFKPFRWLDKVWFIRHPNMPESDDDTLDIDDTLQEAILYMVAADFTRRDGEQSRRDHFLQRAKSTKDRYVYEIFSYLQNISEGYITSDERSDISKTLDRWGLLKFYRVYRLVKGFSYKWDDKIITALDRFMLNEDGSALSPSAIKLWDQFTQWQDGITDDESKPIETLDKIFTDRVG